MSPRAIFGRGNVQPPIVGINPLNLSGNGRLATVEAQSKLAQLVNQISATRRRVLAQWSVRPGDMGGAGTGGASEPTLDYIAYFRIRLSYQATNVRAVIVALPSDNTDVAATPAVQFFHEDVTYTTGGILNANFYRPMAIGKRNTGSLVPNDYFVLSQTLSPENSSTYREGLVPGRDYNLYLMGEGGARVLSVIVYEESGSIYVDNPNDSGGDASCDFDKDGTDDVVTVTDPSRSFGRSYIGGQVIITGSDTAANDGEYIISDADNTGFTFGNASGVTEAFLSTTRYRIRAPSVTAQRAGGPILDDDIERILQIPYEIWKGGGGRLFEWSNYPNPKTRTSASSANIHDTSITAWSSTAPGYWVWPEKQGTYDLARRPVTMWCYTDTDTVNGGTMTFLVNGRTVGTINTTGGTGVIMNTTTGYLDSANTTDKVDVMFNSDGVTVFTVYAFGMYPSE